MDLTFAAVVTVLWIVAIIFVLVFMRGASRHPLDGDGQ